MAEDVGISQTKILQMTLAEHAKPGRSMVLDLEMPREVTDKEVESIAAKLREGGLRDVGVAFGSTEEWPNALRLRFHYDRPTKLGARGLPIALLIVAGLAAGGLALGGGFKIGEAIGSNIIPLALITGAVVVLSVLALSRAQADINIRASRQ